MEMKFLMKLGTIYARHLHAVIRERETYQTAISVHQSDLRNDDDV
jgi:hypothetical protein